LSRKLNKLIHSSSRGLPLDLVVYIGQLIWNGWGRKVLLVWSGWPSEIRWVVVCALAALIWVFLDPSGERRGSSTAQQADLQGPVGCLAYEAELGALRTQATAYVANIVVHLAL
jgi:hypothetical protein